MYWPNHVWKKNMIKQKWHLRFCHFCHFMCAKTDISSFMPLIGKNNVHRHLPSPGPLIFKNIIVSQGVSEAFISTLSSSLSLSSSHPTPRQFPANPKETIKKLSHPIFLKFVCVGRPSKDSKSLPTRNKCGPKSENWTLLGVFSVYRKVMRYRM